MGNPTGYRIERLISAQSSPNDLCNINVLLKELSKEGNPPELTQFTLNSLLENRYRTYVYVSRINDATNAEHERIIGIAMLTVYRKMSGGGRIVGFIDDVVVHSDHKRRGNCSALINALLRHAKNAEVCNVDLTTSRQEALLAYEKIGFSVRKTSPMRYKFLK